MSKEDKISFIIQTELKIMEAFKNGHQPHNEDEFQPLRILIQKLNIIDKLDKGIFGKENLTGKKGNRLCIRHLRVLRQSFERINVVKQSSLLNTTDK